MKFKQYLWAIAALLMANMTFVSCDDNDEPGNGNNGTESACFAYIMYEGAWGSNNAGLAYYPLSDNNAFISDIFYARNHAKMGDLANDIIEYDDCIYVLLNGSKYVARLDENAVEQARYSFPAEDGGPRYMVADDGYLYVSQHGGKVTKLNAQTLKVVGSFSGGDNLEGIAIENDKLYVSNTYKVDGSGNYVYNKEVLVLDAATMKQTGSIAVVENPDRIYEIEDKLYVISKGNYADIQPALQVVDTRSMKATAITSADKIAEGNNGLIYGVRSAYDANWNLQNEFFTYNPKTGAVSNQSFLLDAPDSFSTMAIYMLEVDENSGDIYVGTSDYVTTGTIYRFDKYGNLLTSFDAGGINPKTMIFID